MSTSDPGPSDPLRIFSTLAARGVEYLVIGGVAGQAHGLTRTTQDVDVIPGPGRENARRLAAALVELEARLAGIDAHLLGIDLNAETLADGANFTLATGAGGLDVFGEVPGAAPYGELAGRAEVLEVRGVAIPVVSRDDLLAMKRASARPQDLADIAELTEPFS